MDVLFEGLTVSEQLRFFGRIKGVTAELYGRARFLTCYHQIVRVIGKTMGKYF
jgi:hypothetical protein